MTVVASAFLLLPLRDLSRAVGRRGATPLLRLYTRIWVFCLVYAGMESIFLTPNGIAWFMTLVAIFGLRLEARAYRRGGAPAPVALAREIPDAAWKAPLA
jgi:O-antigen ligase